MNNKKNIFKRIYRGLYEGYKLEKVPKFLVDFESKISVKLFKLLGSISTIFVVSWIAISYNKIFFYIGLFFPLPYLLYKLFYTLCIPIEMYNIIRDKKYQVRD